MNSATLATAIAQTYFPTSGGIAALPADIQQFVKAARQHDWTHEFSDDYDTVKRGRKAEQALKKQLANLLADHEPPAVVEVWNRTVSAIFRNRGLAFTPITTADVYAWAGQEELGL